MLRGRSGGVLQPFPPAIRPEANGNTQAAVTRGAKRQTETDKTKSQTVATDWEQLMLLEPKETKIETRTMKEAKDKSTTT